jgi:DNA-binding NtrC family response regulator
MVAYEWPGNVRELKNAVERLIVRSQSGRVARIDLPPEIQRPVRPLVATTSGATAVAIPTSAADELFDRMVSQRESFWTAVYPAFMARDLTRADLRNILRKGLQQAGGNYKILVQLFNLPTGDYKRFLNFLRKHDCHVPFQPFRTVHPTRDDSAKG